MIVFRFVFLAAAGAALFGLWRVALGDDPRLRFIVTSAFLLRAALGQVLFWISFLGLPLARSLQLGRGLWFFALDAEKYTTAAAVAAGEGLGAISTIPFSAPSVTYTQTLALFSLTFGDVVAVSLLLNLFCYLGACAIIVRWSAVTPGSRTAALIAVAAISLSPAAMLWSTQPLKDTFLQLLVIALIGACFLWQHAWRRERYRLPAVCAAATLIAAFYLVSGIRWYLGLILLGLITLFFGLVATSLRRRRVLAAASGVLVVVVMARLYAFVAAPYLPEPVPDALHLHPSAIRKMAVVLLLKTERTRMGFVQTGGNTSIHPGARLAGAEATDDPQGDVSTPKAVPGLPSQAPISVVTTTDPVSRPSPREGKTRTPSTALERFAARMVAGAAAAALPRALASQLGLVEIGGGRSFWWFVELDTLVFDVVFLLALISITANFRGTALGNSLFWLVLATAVVVFGALVYTVTNFGTLFRLRAMTYTAMALIPLALLSTPAQTGAVAPASGRKESP
jgi:hypothetical protein